MNITNILDADKTVLALAGRLDSGTAPKLLATVMAEIDNHNQILLDFSDVAYVSSAGLRVLLQGHKAAAAGGGALTLCNVGADVMDVLEATGFAVVLNII